VTPLKSQTDFTSPFSSFKGKIQQKYFNGKYPHIYKYSGLWIRIGSGFRDFLYPDPYWESGSGSGSRGKKMKKFQWKNALFSYIKKITNKKVLTTF
jgi:hypothetical protein